MIIEWVVVVIFIFIGLTYLKFEHHANKIKIAVIIIIGFVIYFSITNHFNSEEVDIASPQGIINGAYLYVGWIGSTATSLWDIGTNTASMVGNAVKVNATKQEKPRRR